jgi:hypothetical protein
VNVFDDAKGVAAFSPNEPANVRNAKAALGKKESRLFSEAGSRKLEAGSFSIIQTKP